MTIHSRTNKSSGAKLKFCLLFLLNFRVCFRFLTQPLQNKQMIISVKCLYIVYLLTTSVMMRLHHIVDRCCYMRLMLRYLQHSQEWSWVIISLYRRASSAALRYICTQLQMHIKPAQVHAQIAHVCVLSLTPLFISLHPCVERNY